MAKKGHIKLAGFTYDRIETSAGFDRAYLEKWLAHQPAIDITPHFKPQPFEQLSNVLHKTGYEEEAHQTSYLKRRLLSRARINRAPWPLKPGLYLWHRVILGGLFGYGYRPHRAILLALAIWLSCGWIYHLAGTQGVFVPAVPTLYLSQSPVAGQKTLADECRKNWTTCNDARMREYPEFNAVVYSADLILPLVDFGQDDRWMPMRQSLMLGSLKAPDWFVLMLTRCEVAVGWIVGLIFAAIFSGILKKD